MGELRSIMYVALQHTMDGYFTNIPSLKIADRKKHNKLGFRRVNLSIWDIATKIPWK